MKIKSLIPLFSIMLFFNSCEKENNNSGCPKPSFSVNGGTSTGTSASIQIASSVYGFLELEYGSNGFTRGTGTTLTISGTYYTLNGLNTGTYDIYLRGNCGGTDWSEWAGPKSFLVQQGAPTCPKPTNLSADSNVRLEWSHPNSPQNYQVEYGITGFSIGSGTRVVVNDPYYARGIFSKGTTYDFYVRADCGNNDLSEWAGPCTFLAASNSNMCLLPEYVNVYGIYNGLGQCIGADFEWDWNGEWVWEVVLVSHGNSPDGVNVTTCPKPVQAFFVPKCRGVAQR